MKRALGLGVAIASAAALAAMPTVAHADKAALDCLAGGRKLEEKRRYADAITAWKACLVTTPENAILEAEIAAAAFELHDLDVAEKFARVSIEHTWDPNGKAAALFTLGRVQEERKDATAAIASYTASLALRRSPVVRARLVALDPTAPIPVAPIVPPAFKTIVDEQKAELGMRLVNWWQDDLDGDGKDENIAALCTDEIGVYLIEQQGTLLVANRPNGGREICPDDKPSPGWEIKHDGYIWHSYSVHRASELSRIAVRGHQAVDIFEGEEGADGYFDFDWDALTTSRGDRMDDHPPAVPFVAVDSTRWTSVRKGVSLSATTVGDKTVLHVKSAARVLVAFCPDQSAVCTTATPVRGAGDVTVPDGDPNSVEPMVEIQAGGIKSRAYLHGVDPNELVGGYPSAAPPPTR